MNPDQIREAYCANESMYGYGCGAPDCPHCGGRSDGNPYFQQGLRIKYSPSIAIKNLDSLPKGTGCKFLLVVTSPNENEYVAERWLRKEPKAIDSHKRLICF